MRKQRKTYTPEEKVGIIRKHLLDGTAVSDLCDEYGLHPTVYYRWQKEFFEGGAAAFAKESDRQIGELKRRVAEAQAQLSRKNEVLAEVMEEYVRCKKTLLRGAPRTCRRRNSFGRAKVVGSPRAEAVYFLVACDPGKKLGPGTVANLRVVTPAGDPD